MVASTSVAGEAVVSMVLMAGFSTGIGARTSFTAGRLKRRWEKTFTPAPDRDFKSPWTNHRGVG